MRKGPASLLVAAFACVCAADELAIARDALRDGLYDVARAHAESYMKANSAGLDAVRLVVETHARERRWTKMLATLDGLPEADGDFFVYYRALGLFETGKGDRAKLLLTGRDFTDPVFARLVRRLRARIAADEGKAEEALAVLGTGEGESLAEDELMFTAALLSDTGDRAGATEIWRSIVSAGTNASERARVTACVNLGDAGLLKTAYGETADVTLKRQAGFGYGRTLLASEETFDEGARIIRSLVREAPDAPGAFENFAALATEAVRSDRCEEALAIYREMLTAWPESLRQSSVCEGRGWAFARLGRTQDALESFTRAEETAPDAETKARALARGGDALSSVGRLEEALSVYARVIETYPGTEAARRAEALVGLRRRERTARELYGACRFDEAMAEFLAIAADAPETKSRMEYLAALCRYGMGEDDDAAARMQTLSVQSPDLRCRLDASLWLAKLAFNAGRLDESVRRFLDYAALEPVPEAADQARVWAAKAALASGDFTKTIQIVTAFVEASPDSRLCADGFVVQAEALMESARFNEAVIVLDRALRSATGELAVRANLLRADALFGMGADNAALYNEALDAYVQIRNAADLPSAERIVVSFRIARALEKLRRVDEAIDIYYVDVVLAYREGREKGESYDEAVRSAFSRSAFRLSDEFESRGRNFQAISVLELVRTSDVPASVEASRRIERLKRKGSAL